MNKKILCLFLVIILVFVNITNCFGYETYGGYKLPVDVSVNGQYLNMTPAPFSEDNYEYVSIRAFSDVLGAAITWNNETKSITIEYNNNTTVINTTNNQFIINGNEYYSTLKNVDGNFFATIDIMAMAFGLNGEWNNQFLVYEIKDNPYIDPMYIKPYYTNANIIWIGRIITAESGGEPFVGKIGVGEVIFNRMKSPKFPSSAEEVIFDARNGVQFVTRSPKMYNMIPSRENILAAKIALNGSNVSNGGFYFSSKSIASQTWAGRNRPYATTLYNHVFYK